MEKYFSINKQKNSIRCKIYYSDIKHIKRAVIYLHGFCGHKDNRAAGRFSEYVLKKHKDIAVITYDAPCHGDDCKKKLILSDCGVYLSLVIEYVINEFKPDEIYGYATSFGGYQLLKYIYEAEDPFVKIALRSPAVNMYEVLSGTLITADEHDMLRKNKTVSVGFDRKTDINKGFIDDLKAADITVRDYRGFADDILIIHGTKDEIVPFDTVKAFADKNGIRFIAVENADHRFIDPDLMTRANKEVVSFFGF